MVKTDLSRFTEEQNRSTRYKILLTLKQRGGMTAAELAEALGITSMGVRRHLTNLEQEHLVHYETVQRGRGRPSYLFQLTADAERLFPKNYAGLANELLGYLADQDDGSAVIALFDRRAQRRIRQAQAQLDGGTLAERVAGLADILSGEGYLAEWAQTAADVFILREHNCAVHDIAAEHRAACSSELEFLRAVLPDAEVTRETHIMTGAPCCAYRISRRAETPS